MSFCSGLFSRVRTALPTLPSANNALIFQLPVIYLVIVTDASLYILKEAIETSAVLLFLLVWGGGDVRSCSVQIRAGNLPVLNQKPELLLHLLQSPRNTSRVITKHRLVAWMLIAKRRAIPERAKQIPQLSRKTRRYCLVVAQQAATAATAPAETLARTTHRYIRNDPSIRPASRAHGPQKKPRTELQPHSCSQS